MSNLGYMEKLIVCEIAREAFDVWPGRPEWEQVNPGVNTFDAWRHQQQANAVGFRSLSQCEDRHFAPLKAHFQKLRSQHAAARNRELCDTANGQKSLFQT